MKTMQEVSGNGKALKKAYTLLKQTGRGIKMAADTGYKTGYFMAKHPEIEIARDRVLKNYKAGLITLAGIIIGILGAFMLVSKRQG